MYMVTVSYIHHKPDGSSDHNIYHNMHRSLVVAMRAANGFITMDSVRVLNISITEID